MSHRLAALVLAGYVTLLVFVAATRGAIEGAIRDNTDGHRRLLGVGQIAFDGAGAERWAARFRRERRLVVELRRRLRKTSGKPPENLFQIGPRRAIQMVFGVYAGQALRVAWCESRLSTGATNGQYVGLFQMGSRERATYGDGGSALEQARAAYRYFVSSGRDWSPWSCRP